MNEITYLGPSGVTFSAIAFGKMAETFGIRNRVEGAKEVLATTNEEIVPLIVGHGGYGVIAMDTISSGRVDPPLNSFIELLEEFQDSSCPIEIIGALRMKINFVLMARTGISLRDLNIVLAHPKAKGACKNSLKNLGVVVKEVDSNGKAAELVAQNHDFSMAGALAPMEAAIKYGLKVLSPTFEDEEAITTFFLLGPRGKSVSIAYNRQRALLVFSAKHVPGALAKVLTLFGDKMLNLIYVHSLYVGNSHYDFAVEFELNDSQIGDYEMALSEASKYMGRHISFRPFPII